jgi:hypothetical protein
MSSIENARLRKSISYRSRRDASMSQPVKKLVIDRAKWLRGKDALNDSYLLRPDDGKMCCLGFYAESCGFSLDDLYGKTYPSLLITDGLIPEALRWLVTDLYEDTTAGLSLAQLNDDDQLDEPTREERVAEKFALHGIEVEFVGGDAARLTTPYSLASPTPPQCCSGG